MLAVGLPHHLASALDVAEDCRPVEDGCKLSPAWRLAILLALLEEPRKLSRGPRELCVEYVAGNAVLISICDLLEAFVHKPEVGLEGWVVLDF